jgi:hypothetical protein
MGSHEVQSSMLVAELLHSWRFSSEIHFRFSFLSPKLFKISLGTNGLNPRHIFQNGASSCMHARFDLHISCSFMRSKSSMESFAIASSTSMAACHYSGGTKLCCGFVRLLMFTSSFIDFVCWTRGKYRDRSVTSAPFCCPPSVNNLAIFCAVSHRVHSRNRITLLEALWLNP